MNGEIENQIPVTVGSKEPLFSQLGSLDLKGVCHEIFDIHYIMIRTHLGRW